MAGAKFDIQRLGTFSLLSITNSSSLPLLHLDATIDRSPKMCSATYITNLTLTGSWVEQQNLTKIAFRAVKGWAPSKAESFEAYFDEKWEKVSKLRKSLPFITKMKGTEVKMLIQGVRIGVALDFHMSSDARFLNVIVDGLEGAQQLGLHIAGLLGHDDFTFVTEGDDKQCHKSKPRNFLSFAHASSQII